MSEDGPPKWWKNIEPRAILLGAIIFITTTIIGISFVQTQADRGASGPFDEEIIIPKG